MSSLLHIDDLTIQFRQGERNFNVVKNISLEVRAGESVALVGASGSGKSVSALSVLQLLPRQLARYPKGKILFRTEDVLQMKPQRIRQLRGDDVGMIFQEPLSSLNPLHTIEEQLDEMIATHQTLSKAARHALVKKLFADVGLDFSAARLKNFPHQLSGGQRQRVMIAMAIANNPDLLIADEPTTALDVTVQAQILALIKELKQKHDMALFLISHDLDIVQQMTERVYVMNQGEIVESGLTKEVFNNPQHSYTAALIAAEPSGKAPEAKPKTGEALLEAESVKVFFPIKAGVFRKTIGHVKAVNDISFKLYRGNCLGVVGESGSGKTSLGLAILKLINVEGAVVFLGKNISEMSAKELRAERPKMQMVFQDPFGSLSPRMTIGDIITEGVRVFEKDEQDYRKRAAQALQEVGLESTMQDRYPHEFSGGQRQRIAIARALALRPALIVLDEPTSGLDRANQSKIIALLQKLQEEHNLAYIFISHDLKIVKMLAHDIIVMKNGQAVEQGAATDIFNAPQEPYTKELMKAAFEKTIL